MSFKYIQEHYGVKAEIGRRIRYQDKFEGVIVGADGAYIEVVFDGNKPNDIHIYHPTDRIEYLGMGKVPKMTSSQKRYRNYLKADTHLTFSQWLGIKPPQTRTK